MFINPPKPNKSLLSISTALRSVLKKGLLSGLMSCDASKEDVVAYNCEGLGVLLSDSELRWNALTFRFREDAGVLRVYESELTEVVFNRALSIIVWKNSKTDEVILSRQCIKL